MILIFAWIDRYMQKMYSTKKGAFKNGTINKFHIQIQSKKSSGEINDNAYENSIY